MRYDVSDETVTKRRAKFAGRQSQRVLHCGLRVDLMRRKYGMPKKQKRNSNDVASLLTDLLITQLAASGVQQKTIRQVVGCDMNRVSRIAKHIKAALRSAETRAKEA